MTEDNKLTRIYSNFRGVDFRGEEINLARSPDSLNVWKDYRETESIRTRPGVELKERFWSPVYGVFFYKVADTEMMLVHSGDTLYKIANGTRTVLYSGLREARSDSFVFNNTWYFKDGKHYLQYDGSTIKDVEGFVPTTHNERSPSGGGNPLQDVNMLTGRRINTFVSDGTSQDYYLDAQNCDELFQPKVYVNDVEMEKEKYFFDAQLGKIGFITPPPAPLTDGQANIKVEFSKTIDGYADRIKKCTMLQVFDNRVFFSGNEDYPNTMWYCSVNDPSYCSDVDYYNEGLDTAEVRGLVAGNNVLWVFREPSQSNTTVFYHTPVVDSEEGKIYPFTHSSISTGCTGRAINFNDDIVFFSDRGMEGISGDITTEQAIAHRSTLVDRKLIAERDYKDMILVEWEGYLLVIIGQRVYLADSRSSVSVESHKEYEWFYWILKNNITAARVHNGVLYLGTADGVYTLTDYDANVISYWVTPKDKFKYPQKLKTTNKRGCVVEATGDISVYAKTEDTDFELIGNYENITDYFACRVKRKKFKDLQLKFYTTKRFSIETATMEVFVGGYIKR